MRRIVTLRKSGNSLFFTVPSDLHVEIGTKYHVTEDNDGVITYKPVHHKNIFSDPKWKNYDYQNDLKK